MRNVIFALLFLTIGIYALDDPTRPYSFSARDTIKASKFEANFDTIYHAVNKLNDSIGDKFLRTAAMDDSTWTRIKTDTVSSNPIIDSILGPTVLTGKLTCDTLSASYYKFQHDTTVTCSLYDGSTLRGTSICYIKILFNSICILSISSDINNVSITGSNDVEFRMPSIFRPNFVQTQPLAIEDNGTEMLGVIVFPTDAHPKIRMNFDTYLSASTTDSSIRTASVTYSLIN